MDSTLQDILGALLCGSFGYGGWRVIRFLRYKPPVTRSLDYLYGSPELRARLDAEIVETARQRANQPAPIAVRMVQEIYARVQEKLPSPPVEESPKPAPVAVEEQVGSEIDNLAVKDPKAYLERMLGCLDRIYDAKDKDGKPVREKLAREKLVDNTGILTQSEWDYLIGPEVAGTKQPGILRELGMVHNHTLPESRIEVKHYFMMGYLGWYGYDIPGLIDAIKAIDPSVIEQWEEWKSKGK